MKIPDSIGSQAAAAAMLQGMTAHYLTHSTYPLKEGEVALVHAAAGGVGLLLVQMAKMRGARVVAGLIMLSLVLAFSLFGRVRENLVDEDVAALMITNPNTLGVFSRTSCR